MQEPHASVFFVRKPERRNMETISYDRKVLWTSRLLILVLFFTMFIFPVCYAADVDDNPWMAAETLGLECYEKAYDIYMGPFEVINEVNSDDGYFKKIRDYIGNDVNPNASGDASKTDVKINMAIGTLTSDFEPLCNLILILGFAWMLIHAISQMIMAYESDKDPQEAVYKAILQIGIAGIFMCQLPNIMSFIMALGQAVCNAIGSVGTDISSRESASEIGKKIQGILLSINTDEDITCWEDVRDKGALSTWLWDMGICSKLAIPSIISYFAKIIAEVIIATYYIEIGFRKILCPLAAADVYREGMRSAGMRFFKKMFAIYLKIVICVLSLAIGGALLMIAAEKFAEGNGYGTFGTIILMSVSMVVSITMMVKGSVIADEAMGA